MKAWLELSRLSNAPTCVTNVLVGAAIAASAARPDGPPAGLPWRVVAIVAVAVVLMYVAGMALNDVVDATRDAAERPGRPIPSGRISRQAALVYALVCLGAGIATVALTGVHATLVAGVLAAAIVGYDLLHARAGGAEILMGLCRTLVYLVAAVAVGAALGLDAWDSVGRAGVAMAVALGFFVAALTRIATEETAAPTSIGRAIGRLLPLIAVGPTMFVIAPDPQWPAWGFGAAMIIWMLLTLRHLHADGSVVRAILGWLAAICLIDAFYLALLDQPILAVAAGLCFVATLGAHRLVLGT